LKINILHDKRYQLILKTSLSGVFFRFVALAYSFISVPIILHQLGKFNYGLWITLSSSISLIGYADLGIGNGLLNLISSNHNNSKAKKTIVSSAFYSLIIVSFVCWIIFISFFQNTNFNFINNDEIGYSAEVVDKSIFYLVTFFFISLPFSIIFRIQEASQEGFYVSYFNLIGILLNIIFLSLVVYFNLDIVDFILFNSSVTLITYLLNWIYLYSVKKYRIIFPSIRYFDFLVAKKIINLGIIFFILSFFTIIGSSSDNLIISKIINTEAVTDFEILRKLFSIVALTNIFLAPIWPAFSEAIANNDIYWAKKTFIRCFKFGLIICTIFTIFVMLISKDLIRIWVGKSYSFELGTLLLFSLSSILTFYGGLMSVFINGTNIFKKQIPIIAITTLFSILFKIYLSRLIGINGILIGGIISSLIFYVVPIYLLFKKYLTNL
jgi:O-antigen/teichoic acid export membrane protein